MPFGIDFRGIRRLIVASGCLWYRSATFISSRNMSGDLADGSKEKTTYPLTNTSQVLTTSSIVGRSPGFADQHFSMNFHISAVSPSCSAAWGLVGLFPLAIWKTTDSFLTFSNGTFPLNTSTANIANAKTSADLDAVMGLKLALVGGSMISGASHREDPATPGVASIVKIGFEMMGFRP